MGGRRVRRAGRHHAPHRARIPGARLHRPDHRGRRRHAAVPPGRGDAGQDRQQRLGRLRMLLGAHAAGDAGRRARGAGRHHRHHGAAGQAAGRAPAERQAGAGRLHELPAQPDQQGRLAAAPQHPQRLQDHGAAGRRRRLEPGAGADALLVDVPRRDARGPAHRDATRRLVLLPHQPVDLVLGHAGAGREDGALPVRGGVRLHARREQPFRRRAAARRHRPGKPAADPHRRHQVRRAVLGPPGLRAAPAGGRDAWRNARLHRHRDRAGTPHRPAGALQRRHQPRRRRCPAAHRARRLRAAEDVAHDRDAIWDAVCAPAPSSAAAPRCTASTGGASRG